MKFTKHSELMSYLFVSRQMLALELAARKEAWAPPKDRIGMGDTRVSLHQPLPHLWKGAACAVAALA